jgi:phospholipid-translocating ATPase
MYVELQKGRLLCLRVFITWVLKAVYQGGSIMILSAWLLEDSFLHIIRSPPFFRTTKSSSLKYLFIVAIIVTMFVISITFTALIVTELFMVAIQINHWHFLMVSSSAATLLTRGV